MFFAWGDATADTVYLSPVSGSNKVDWYIGCLMDHGDGTNIADYKGGLHTYHGHQGTDIVLYDFKTMDDGIDVLAAAPGTIVYVHDGEFDRQTNRVPDAGGGNMVIIQHADYSQALYCHFKKNSILVTNGQKVAAGDPLGQVGSSGASDCPHLHFEVRVNGVPVEIMTNQAGQAQAFDWFGSYSNQVVRQLISAGVTVTNDPQIGGAMHLQSPRSYSSIHSGAFCVWVRFVGGRVSDVLRLRMQSVSGPGPTLDFSEWPAILDRYYTCSTFYWTLWGDHALVDKTTYKIQYKWNDDEWLDSPNTPLVSTDDSVCEVYLSRFSPGYTNAPAAPLSLDISAGEFTDKTRLSWKAGSTNVVSYEIYRSSSVDFKAAMLLAETSNTGYDDRNVSPGSTNYYWVRGVNPAGAGNFTGPVSGWTSGTADFDVVPVYRFYSYGAPESTYTHLWTICGTEKEALSSWPSWRYEGVAWYALTNSSMPASAPLCRLYEPNIRRHLYTVDNAEYSILTTTSWNGEGVQYYVYPVNSEPELVPVYRFYHQENQNHHFTVDAVEKDTIIEMPEWGYTYEGVAFYVFPPDRESDAFQRPWSDAW